MTAKKTRPDSFEPTVAIIAKRQPVIDELIQVIKQEMRLLKDHPLFPPPQQLVNWVDEHIRDHLVVRRRFELFTQKIEGKDPQKLSDTDYGKLDDEFTEIMGMCARITDRWNMISEELNAWREDMDKMTDMFVDDAMDDAEDADFKNYMAQYGNDGFDFGDEDWAHYQEQEEDEWSEEFDIDDAYADEDEEYDF